MISINFYVLKFNINLVIIISYGWKAWSNIDHLLKTLIVLIFKSKMEKTLRGRAQDIVTLEKLKT